MNKPFFVHINPYQPGTRLPAKTSRGATIYVVPRADQTCEVGVAYCSPRDSFNKMIGRGIAQAKERTIINKRRLPQHVADVANKARGSICYYNSLDYEYLLRNFL